jgi:hypothetical protein
MARRSGKGPLQVSIDDEAFQRALKTWGPLSESRTIKVLDETENLILASLQNKTPVLTGRAKGSWTKVKFSLFSRGVVSFLVYIRRLELGRRKKSRRPGQKLPVGGYRMVRDTEKAVPQMINYAAQKVASGSL